MARTRPAPWQEAPLTSLTLITALVVAYGTFGRRGYGRALALAGATPAGAAAVFGAVAVPTFYAVAIGAALGVVVRLLRRHGDPEAERDLDPIPGASPLALLLLVGVLVTLLAPYLFNGLAVLSSSGPGLNLSAGLLTKSNLAQLVYLGLSVAVVVFLARSRQAGPEVVGTAVCLATLLSAWAYLGTTFGAPYPAGLFDNSPAFVYQETLPGGAPRVRGIFSEPSGLAASSLLTMAYTASRWRAVGPARAVGLLVVFAVALYLGLIATSTTFFVAGAVLLAIALAVGVGGFVLRGSALSSATAGLVCVAAVASLWALPWAANAIGAIVSDKVDSASFSERSGADAFSYRLVAETYGFGTGLGANRASSFLASLTSTVGVTGAVLLAAAIIVVVRRAWPSPRYRPVVWALVALLITKVIAGPDLADSSGVLWMSLGVLAHGALERTRALRGELQPSAPPAPPAQPPTRRAEDLPR